MTITARHHPQLQAPVRFICATCGYHTLYARYLVEHVVREGTCRSCGFRHDAGDCPRWPGPTNPEPDRRAVTRPTPDLLSGCTCGGIGDTGSHFAGCAWAVR